MIDVEDVLDDIDYKPGWRLRRGSDRGRQWLQVVFDANDVVTGHPQLQHGRKWFLSPHMTVSEVIATAFKAFLTAEEHECREAFTYRAQRVFGPHIDFQWLAGAMGRGDVPLDVRVQREE